MRSEACCQPMHGRDSCESDSQSGIVEVMSVPLALLPKFEQFSALRVARASLATYHCYQLLSPD
jgi:hypothetical protein